MKKTIVSKFVAASINRLSSVWNCLACANRYSHLTSLEDCEVFKTRASSEGAQFYARDLTALRSDLLCSIERGLFHLTARFHKKLGTKLPAFLFGAFERVFDKKTGVRLCQADACAVDCLNQLTAVFGKIEGGHTPQSEVETIERFLETEREMETFQIPDDSIVQGHKAAKSVRVILENARHLIAKVLCDANPQCIIPNHGSGVSSCGTPVWERYSNPRYVSKLDACYPISDWFYLDANHFCEELNSYLTLEEVTPSAKVLLVPKDARGPRLISCEPREFMWIQQGLMVKLIRTIESHALTRGSVFFTNQTVNQRVARLGSVNWSVREDGQVNCNQMLATLDLKDASDRISLALVERLWPGNWFQALNSCRSETTILPNAEVVRLRKFAPMGSACCFPVMALTLWAIITASLPPHTKVCVYGDDIIVPTRFASGVVNILEAVGLKVNGNKSFVDGPFRESCGKEYYAGIDVTPVRLRRMVNDGYDCRDALISFANNLFTKFGYEQEGLVDLIGEYYGRNIPQMIRPESASRSRYVLPAGKLITTQNSAVPLTGVIWKSWVANNSWVRRRWNRDLQKYEFLVRVPVPRVITYDSQCWSQLFRSLVNPRYEAGEPLGVDAVANSVRYVKRWRQIQDIRPEDDHVTARFKRLTGCGESRTP